MILGVDPGARTGIGIIEGRKVIHAHTAKAVDACAQLVEFQKCYGFTKAVVEKPKIGVLYMRHLTKGNAVLSMAGQVKLAMNVGQNIALTQQIVATLKSVGVRVLDVNPKRGQTKWDIGYWCRVFNWASGRVPSEHARDAVCLAFAYETWPGWNLPNK